MRRRSLSWPLRLDAWARGQLGQPFAWGTCDCAALARGALEAMLGHPVARELPAYADAAGAKRTWEAAGGLRGYLRDRLGALELPALIARPGDILVAPTDGFETALVFVGPALLGVEPEASVRWYPYAAFKDVATAYRID